MLLAIDLGNTRTKLGLFDGSTLVDVSHQPNGWGFTDLPAKMQQANAFILSATGALEESLEEVLKQKGHYIRLSDTIQLPFENTYETPKTLGRDRIAGVSGALVLYPGENALVIDAGTCITYDVITRQKVYLGGTIAPGIEMRLKAMHTFTARLPLVQQQTQEHAGPQSLIGRSTEQALLAGGQLAAVYEMRECIRQIGQKHPGLRVILTGGDATYFSQNLGLQAWVQPHIVLYGLQQIYRYNTSNE